MTREREMTNIRKLLAANIKKFRLESGLTQSKLAERVETATHYIAMIEGCKNFPSPEMIERIAAGLDKDSADLFTIDTIKHEWKETILSDIEKLINKHLEDVRKKPAKKSGFKKP
jgi:transcriptional regulator with XRE-family HTH domain